jgi:AraC-like DNA-binding protein
MDALSGLLTGPRAREAFLLRAILGPPWSLRIQDEAPLAVVAVTRGEATIWADGDEPTRLGPGDVVIARGPEPYTIADDPQTPIQTVVHPQNRCQTIYGEDLAEKMSLGVRSWGNTADGATTMLIGTYPAGGEVGRRLLGALPHLVVVRDRDWRCPLLPLLAEEVIKDQPGQEAVLDRLLDLLVIAVLRAWFDRAETDAPRWYRASGDPVVGQALRLLHHNPEQPWTVAGLASETGVSRAALARRFTEQVGEPPMAYLTGWRLALAADLLQDPEATLESVAGKVGYGSGFALSAAFKRVRGVTPRDYRLTA